MCTFLLQNGALWDMGLVHCEICDTGPLPRCMHYRIITVRAIMRPCYYETVSSQDPLVVVRTRRHSGCLSVSVRPHNSSAETMLTWFTLTLKGSSTVSGMFPSSEKKFSDINRPLEVILLSSSLITVTSRVAAPRKFPGTPLSTCWISHRYSSVLG